MKLGKEIQWKNSVSELKKIQVLLWENWNENFLNKELQTEILFIKKKKPREIRKLCISQRERTETTENFCFTPKMEIIWSETRGFSEFSKRSI